MSNENCGNWPQLWPDIPALNLDVDEETVTGISPISVIRVYGKPGAGKTLMALRIIARPPQSECKPTVLWDYELSSLSYKSQYALAYHDMTSVGTPTQTFEVWLEQMRAIEPGQHAVAVIDPAEEWEEGLKDWVMNNPRNFGYTPGQFVQSGRPSGMYWGAVKSFEKTVLTELANKVQTIVLINHIRQAYNGNAPVPGKYEPKGLDTLRKLSTIEAWLMPNAKGVGAPSARILRSRLNITDWETVDEFGVPGIRPILPLYITEFTGAALRDYLKNPREKFTKSEMQNFDPSQLALSDEERQSLEASILSERAAIARSEEQAEENRRKAQEQAAKNKLMDDLISKGYFQDRTEIGKAAHDLTAKEVTVESTGGIEQYGNALVEWAKETYPERFEQPEEA